ncbi:MAG: phage tail assembly protein [Robiginitomaculum sp.]|nr:phage tail assembly protein [Robiginitomaculum sp.]
MKKITLTKPIENGDKKITSVTLRKPNAGEMRGLSLAEVAMLDIDTLITLIPRITTPSISEVQAEALPFEDIMAIGKALVADRAASGNGTTPKP